MSEPHRDAAPADDRPDPDLHAEAADAGGHGHGDHDQDEYLLGPVDYVAWGAGILGVAIGLVMWLCFVAATSVATGS